MTTKQLHKLAKINGWIKQRNGGSHFVYRHEQANLQVTIPYQVKNDFVGRLIAKQLAV
jgi:predicted RNA binding protein YcfA (HicA-like mRNA interferase family)